MTAFVCSMGCCGGCERCFGNSLGCHQEPCRCELPCDKDCHNLDSCDPKCQWHRMDHDTRDIVNADYGEEWEPDDFDDWPPCPVCNEAGPCAFDDLGRPLIYGDPIDFRAFGMWMHVGCFALGHVSSTGQIGFESGRKGYIRSLPPHRIRHHVEGTW